MIATWNSSERRNNEELLNGCAEWIAYNWADDRAYAMRAIVYYYKKDYDQAISDFDTAISQAPENAGYYYNRGVAYRKMGKNTEAQADFDKAKQLGYTVPQ
jgi:tetratricopeptide (TPR) repeat protein